MKLKDINEYDIVNYKEASMFLAFPSCTFKCERDCGKKVCQNSALYHAPDIEFSIDEIVDRYCINPLTHAVVCGGMEPFDSYNDLLELIAALRKKTSDTIVIYTGYKEDELEKQLAPLHKYINIIVKFGRFIPDMPNRYDELLGVTLASHNQYAKKISV